MQTMKRAVVPAATDSGPAMDVLEKGWLHRLMLLAVVPATWPVPIVASLLALVGVGVALWWRLWIGEPVLSVRVGLLLAVVFAADGFWLWALPRLAISWGEWRSHVLVLAAPRAVVALACAVLAGVWSVDAGVLLLAVGQLTGTVLLLVGGWLEPHRIALTELEITVPGLTAPVRLLHVTDLHVERFSRREAAVIKLAQAANPDLIVVTGDYMNLSYVHDPQAQADSQRVLAALSAPGGVYATLGSPPLDVRSLMPDFFADLPVHLLRREARTLDLGAGRRLTLLGMDCSHDLSFDAALLDEIVAETPSDCPRILLFHSPELMPQAVAHGLDVYLCGHTHGGQVRLPGYGALLTSSQLGKRYEMGHYHEKRTHLYVSRGIGLEGLSAPRIRFLCPPELTLVTLRPAPG
jgi:predicted MPP superfamily phosphohydrolase